MRHEQARRASLAQAAALCGLSGVTVALVPQDATVLLPFVVAEPVGALVMHALSRTSRRLVSGIAATLVVAGLAAVAYGRLISDDGTLQAVGVLGGAAIAAAGVGLYGVLRFPRWHARRPTVDAR